MSHPVCGQVLFKRPAVIQQMGTSYINTTHKEVPPVCAAPQNLHPNAVHMGTCSF